jgi:hypothetical protein
VCPYPELKDVARGKILHLVKARRRVSGDGWAEPVSLAAREGSCRPAVVHDFQKYVQARDGVVDGIYRLTEEGGYAFFTYDGFAQQIQEHFSQRDRFEASGRNDPGSSAGSGRRFWSGLLSFLRRGRRPSKERPRLVQRELGPPVGFVLGLMRSAIMKRLAEAGFPLRRIFIELRNTGRITAEQHRQLMLAHEEACREVQRMHRLLRSLNGLPHHTRRPEAGRE